MNAVSKAALVCSLLLHVGFFKPTSAVQKTLMISRGKASESSVGFPTRANSNRMSRRLGNEVVALEDDTYAHSSSVVSVSFSPDGYFVASAGEDLRLNVWQIGSPSSDDVEVSIFQSLNNLFSGNAMNVVSYSPTGDLLLVGGWYSKLYRAYSIEGKRVAQTFFDQSGTGSNTNDVVAQSFSPDGSLFVNAPEGGEFYVYKTWDACSKSGSEDCSILAVTDTDDCDIISISWGPTGKIAAGCSGGSVQLRDESTGELLDEYDVDDTVTSVSYFPSVASSDSENGEISYLVSGSTDGFVHIWTDSQALLTHYLSIEAHTDQVNTVAMARHDDDIVIASGGDDGFVYVWGVECEGAELGRSYHASSNSVAIPVLSISFSADGNRIVLGLDDGSVKLWDLSSIGACTSSPLSTTVIILICVGGGLFAVLVIFIIICIRRRRRKADEEYYEEEYY